ncbi:magnesium-translocating P-type ATPase [Streptomyces qinglanensis]|uniref:magnesium-translocating P-type ATPase n=1 Tax=Streptomyces qinglanensis TaxID=943816 RepID=UPI003D734910
MNTVPEAPGPAHRTEDAAPARPGGGTALAAHAPLTALRHLETGPRGLTEAEAEERLARHGENTPPVRRTPSLAGRLVRRLREPFTAVLLLLGLVSAAIGSVGTACVILALVTVSCVLRAGGELRADRSVAGLRALVAGTVTVLRRRDAHAARPDERELPAADLVPGDVIRLGPGDLVPADVLLLSSTGLVVGQAQLTGESGPLGKHQASAGSGGAGTGGPGAVLSPPDPATGTALFDEPHLCFQGSTVLAGGGRAVVLATGGETRLAAGHRHTRPRQSAFDRALQGTAWILVRFMLLTPPVVLAADAVVSGRGVAVLPFAVAVAVSLTPEMLPVVVTAVLARGAASLAREREVIVRRLPALHDLGAMDVLCLDKTGTLTQDRPVLDRAVNPAGAPDAEVLRWAARNALWTLQLAETPVVDTLDDAILHAAAERYGPSCFEDEFEGVAVLPFDPVRRLSTAVLRASDRPGTHLLVVKGAVEAVLERCVLAEAEREELRRTAARYAADGLRLLAVATAERPSRAGPRPYSSADERGLSFRGLVALRDALAPDAPEALRGLREQGVDVKILTGDHPGTAARVCRELGLEPGAEGVLTADRIDRLADGQLAEAVGRVTVFARCTPRHKARVVAALRAAGHTTGFLGDGVNDLAALRSADVGLCPRDAVPTARESADVVLGERPFAAVEPAVTAGRHSSVTLTSYLRVALSCNLGNAVAMLAAALLFPFVPMLPAQVLVQNLFFDAAQLAFAFDRRGPAELRRPAALRPGELLRFITGFGLLNAAADLATFGVLAWTVAGAGTEAGQGLFHAGWFTENLLTQAMVMVLLRSGRGIARQRPPGPVPLAAALLAVVGIVLPLTPLGPALGMVTALTASSYALLALVLALYGAALVAARRRGVRTPG